VAQAALSPKWRRGGSGRFIVGFQTTLIIRKPILSAKSKAIDSRSGLKTLNVTTSNAVTPNDNGVALERHLGDMVSRSCPVTDIVESQCPNRRSPPSVAVLCINAVERKSRTVVWSQRNVRNVGVGVKNGQAAAEIIGVEVIALGLVIFDIFVEPCWSWVRQTNAPFASFYNNISTVNPK
jgi:hypothetical protein